MRSTLVSVSVFVACHAGAGGLAAPPEPATEEPLSEGLLASAAPSNTPPGAALPDNALTDGGLLDAAAFGLAELPAGGDATPVFRRAIEACKQAGAKGLRVPAGEWRLHPDYALERRMAVANHDRGIRRTVFLIEGFDGFTLDAPGARFVCHGEMIPISVDDSTDVRLRGFSLDWENPFYLQSRVIAVHPERNAFDLRVREGNFYQVRGDRLVFRGKQAADKNEWKRWAPLPTERTTWERNLQWNVWFEGATGRPLPSEQLWRFEPDTRVREVRPRVVRLFDALPRLPEVGWVSIVKGKGSPNRTSPAIRLARSRGVVLEDVTIHHAGGMGVIGQRCEDVRLSRVRVALQEGTDRMVTSSADATHFNGCRGKIVIEDCLFENMLDDATNVHGCFLRVERRTAPNTVACRLVHSQQRGLKVFDPGERIRFVDSDGMQPYGDATVEAVRVFNDDLVEVRLDRLPPGGLRPRSAVYNLSWQPSLDFRRNTVRNNRGRSMLVATSGRVRIEDNTFERSTYAGVQLEGDNHFWYESAPTTDVAIRGNVFRDIGGYVLSIVPQLNIAKHPEAVYHAGVLFEDNVVYSYHRRQVRCQAVDGLAIVNNRFETSSYRASHFGPGPSFFFRSGRGIVLQGNRSDATPPLPVKAATPSARPEMRDNAGIQLAGPPKPAE